MKKVTIMLSCVALLMFACSNEEDIVTVEPVSALAIDYLFNGERVTVDFRETPAGEIVPIESAGLNRMQEIAEQYSQLIYSPISDNEMNLFADEDQLYSSLNITKKGSNSGHERALASESSSAPFLTDAVRKITLYNNKYFLNPLLDLANPCFPGISGNPDYWIERRLQNFNDGPAYNCSGNEIVYNDIVSSMRLEPNSNGLAFRFFVDKNFGASSLWLTGATLAVGFDDLSRQCYGFLNPKHWDNKISSAKIINLVTGQELNGLISTGGGGGSTNPGNGDSNGAGGGGGVDIDTPVIQNL